MTKKKVLVTGSNGLLGQKIIYSLIERKDIDLLASSKGLNRLITKSGYKYIDLDITRKEEVKKVLMQCYLGLLVWLCRLARTYCHSNQLS